MIGPGRIFSIAVTTFSMRFVGRTDELIDTSIILIASRYGWSPDDQFDEKVDDINSLYQQAQNLAQKGEVVMSIDEMTGVQALERKHPGLPMAPGRVEWREFEYIRHGTQSFIVSFAVANGKVDIISGGDMRNEDDLVSHIEEVVESSLSTSCWHFVADNLNISISINRSLL